MHVALKGGAVTLARVPIVGGDEDVDERQETVRALGFGPQPVTK